MPDRLTPNRTIRQAHGSGQEREILNELIETGMEAARDIHRQVTQGPAGTTPETILDVTSGFERAGRAVRRGILLARSLDAAAQPTHDPAQRLAARRRIRRDIEDAIERRTARETTGSKRRDAAAGRRPFAEIAADICRDLGLAAALCTPAWKSGVRADIVALCARAAGLTPEPPAAPIPLPTRPRTARLTEPGEPGAILLDYTGHLRGRPK